MGKGEIDEEMRTHLGGAVPNTVVQLRVPLAIEALLARLHGAGFSAYLVGGCVRDTLLGKEPKDWDITTSALPEQIGNLFSGSLLTNRFGTVLVPSAGGGMVEITTYRHDGVYSDHRRPDEVRFTSSLEEDLQRRDFTINALAYSNGQIVDIVGGVADLKAGTLRTVGDAKTRFGEDALRMLRAARFTVQLNLRVDPALEAAMATCKADLAHIARERVHAEFEKILLVAKPAAAFALLARTGALSYLFPTLAATSGIPQSRKAGMDVLAHTLLTLDSVPYTHPQLRILRWAALCHDLGKPVVWTRTRQLASADMHFFNHDVEGERVTRSALRALKLDEATLNQVCLLVRNHMFWFDSEWTGAATRRFIQRVGLENVPLLLELRKADVRGGGKQVRHFPALAQLEQLIAEEIARASAFSLKDLKVDGSVLIQELGLKPGKPLGLLLKQLFEAVTEEPALNEKDALLAHARMLLEAGASRG